MTETALVGRASEIGVIERSLCAVGNGEFRVVAVSGEPGIGKTRLLSELSARADAKGCTVLTGRATELEGEPPYAALIEALDGAVSALEPRRLQALADRLPPLVDVLPALSGLAAAAPTPAGERYRHHRALCALLEELAERRPLVLALDDLHWADAATVETITHLLRRPPNAHVLLALAHRVGHSEPALDAALAAAVREGHADRLRLRTLTEEQAAALMAGAPDRRRRWIFRESGGNPFYIEQLTRLRPPADAERPARVPESLSGFAIPVGVLAVIEQELRHLPADAREMLEGAAVAGEPFDPELAADTAGLDPAGALALLDALVAADMVRPDRAPREFRFRHPIVRRAVYDAIAPGRRLAAHARAERALASRGAPAAARAHHISLSARLGDLEAIAVLEQAAAEVASTAPRSAARLLSVALSLLPADALGHRRALLPALAQAQAADGQLAAARETLVEITDSLPTGTAWAQAVATLASVELAVGRHSGARQRLESALASIGDETSPAAVPLLVALAMDISYQGEFARAARACETALRAAAGERSAAGALARTVLALMLELQGAPTMERAKDQATLAAAEFDELTDAQIAEQLDLPYYLGLVETLLERYEDAIGHMQRGVRIALAAGNSQFTASIRAFIAYCMYYRGDVDESLRVCGEAVESARLIQVPAVSSWVLSVATSVWSAVDAAAALRLGEEALAVLPDVDDGMLRDTTHGHFALVCASAGQPERCIEHLVLAGAPEFQRFGEAGRQCLWTEALVRSTLALGRLEEAREWAAHGDELAHGLGLPVAEAATRRGRALMLLADGQPAAAAEHAFLAARVAEEHGARLEAARSFLISGRALAAAGDRDGAIAQLRAVHAELGPTGARRLEQEFARELRSLGAAAPAPVARRVGDRGTVELSRREREIASLVAAGNSNPEIAQVLFLSRKTIEGHLRRIFVKLDVSSRAQLAAAIAREQAGAPPERA